MQTQFIVSHAEQQLGPFTVEQIVQKINSRELMITDYLFDEGKSDWVALMEHPMVTELATKKKPSAPPRPQAPPHVAAAPKPSAPQVSGVPEYMGYEWFILKGENKFGPFSYVELVKMLQEKQIFEFDFTWHSGLTTWTRMAEMPEFQASAIMGLKQADLPDLSESFFRRRHKRVSFNASIVVHDNKTVWKGEGLQISQGGAGLLMDNAMLVPGQTLYLHFKPGDGIPPFNATCEIVSKKFEKGVKNRDSAMRYGVKFVSIAPTAQDAIVEFTQRSEAA